MRIFAGLLSMLSLSGGVADTHTIFIFFEEPDCPKELL